LVQDNAERISDPGPYSSLEEAQDALLLEQLPSIGDEAKARGVTLLLEPVNRFESEYLNSVTHAARLCKSLNHDHIGLTCDFFHMQIEELSVERSVSDAGKWVKHVHLAENTRVEPGPGSMDFVPGFRALKRIGYGGIVALECRSLSGPAEQVLPGSVKYIRKLWNEA
jgi:sugar phosphate isomerase/epimerase